MCSQRRLIPNISIFIIVVRSSCSRVLVDHSVSVERGGDVYCSIFTLILPVIDISLYSLRQLTQPQRPTLVRAYYNC